MTGLSKSRLYALKKQYKSGDNNLIIKKRGKSEGNKKISNDLDNQIIQNLILEKKIWDKKTLQHMIERKLNRKLSISTINNYIKQKRIYFDNNIQHPNGKITIKQWIEYNFSDFLKKAQKDNAIICWTDAYCKQEIQANVYLIRLIVYPYNKFMFSLDACSDIVDNFIEYLTILTTHFENKVFLIADSLDFKSITSEEQTKISKFIQRNSKKIELFK